MNCCSSWLIRCTINEGDKAVYGETVYNTICKSALCQLIDGFALRLSAACICLLRLPWASATSIVTVDEVEASETVIVDALEVSGILTASEVDEMICLRWLSALFSPPCEPCVPPSLSASTPFSPLSLAPSPPALDPIALDFSQRVPESCPSV